MVKRFRGLHPASVIVFIIGVVLGITGVTLAIVFGVKCNTSCPACPPTAAPPNSLTDCDAKLFTIRTGVSPSTGITWSDDLNNSSSQAFQNASTAIGQNLTNALDGSSSSARAVVLDTQPVKYVVIVTKFERGQNDMVIAYASAAATGEATVISDFDDVTAVAESRLNDTTSTVSPAVNVDSMQFCDSPNTNLSSTGPSPTTSGTCPPPVTCPTVTAITCENCPPQTECPTTCPPPITCPTIPPVSCEPCSTPSQTTCQPCPTCPSGGTCPPPIVCPNITTPAPCDCPTSPSISTTRGSTTLLTTLSTLSSISTTSPTSSPCPVYTEPPSCPTLNSATCPPCQDCPTFLPPSTDCPSSPPPSTCPTVTCSPTTCPTCPECPTDQPPATCPTVTCPETTCPTGSTFSSTSTTASSTSTTTTGSTTTTSPTTTASPLPTTTAVPETCPPCQCTTPFWTSTPSTSSTSTASPSTAGSTSSQSTLTSISTSTAASTASQSTSTVTTAATNTMGTTSLPISTSTVSTQTSTEGSTSVNTVATPTTTSLSTAGTESSVSSTSTSATTAGTTEGTSSTTAASSVMPSTNVPISSTSQGSTVFSTSATSQGSTIGSSTPQSTSTVAATTSGMSSTVSSTVETTTSPTTTAIPTTMTTTMEPCPGGKYIYDGDIAVIFEATYLPDSVARTEQNVMMNTFISTQLLQYGNGGRTASQKGGYDIDDQITRVLAVPYPFPDSYPISVTSFKNGPRSVDGFNASLIAVDTLMDTTDVDARIDDGLQFTIKATDRGNYSAAVIIAISDAFVADADFSAQQLRAMGYHIFTVALNSTKDFSLLASDANSVFTLPNPKISGDAQKVSLAIGDFLVSQSYQCVGATSAPTQPTAASATPPSTTIPTTTSSCKEEYLTRDVIYMFEDTVTNPVQSNMSATFLNMLIPLAQRDLRGSGKDSIYSTFSILPYPDSDEVCLGVNCNFGQVPLSSVSVYTQTFITAAVIFNVAATPNGINEGLLFSQNLQTADGTPRNDGREEIIILFANSGDGVTAAQATAKNLMDQNIGIITVAVGGDYELAPLSSPDFTVHKLDSTTNSNQLAQDIITEMASLGTSCDIKTTTGATAVTGQTTSNPTSSTSTAASTALLSTTTDPSVCREEYLKRDIIYMFEDTVTDLVLSNMSAIFLNTLIPLAQRDLRGSGKESNYSIFSMLAYPDSNDVCLGLNCNFGQVPLSSVSVYTQTFLTAAGIYSVKSTANGINDGLIFSQNLHTADGTPRNDGRDEIIVLFANSGDGVAAAQATAKSLMDQNVGIITVAVGGQYNLGPLSSPGFKVHQLDSTTDPNQLAQDIITDMASLGTECVV